MRNKKCPQNVLYALKDWRLYIFEFTIHWYFKNSTKFINKFLFVFFIYNRTSSSNKKYDINSISVKFIKIFYGLSLRRIIYK